jgi:Tat protein secretion system quality control protein TatD with DNase activity
LGEGEIQMSNAILFDSHCHLTDRGYSNNLKEVINRAREVGVKYLLTAGLNRIDSQNSLKICHEYESI